MDIDAPPQVSNTNSDGSEMKGADDVKSKPKDDNIVDHPRFDLDGYIREYRGRTRVERLLFIATRCPNVRTKAIQAAIQAVLESNEFSRDMPLYKLVIETASKFDPKTKDLLDVGHINEVTESNNRQKVKMEDDIHKWRNLSHRENSKNAWIMSAKFHQECGEFDRALQKFLEAKEYSFTAQDLISVHLMVSEASIRSGCLRTLARECEPGLENQSANLTQKSKFNAYLGLYHLKLGNWKIAQRHFLAVNFASLLRANNISHIMSNRDIAVYGGLCALASLNRNQIRSNVLENSSWVKYLDHAPRVKSLIQGLNNSKYDIVMESLEELKKDLQLDYYLHSRVNDLLLEIRGKALVQYLIPFSTMELSRLNTDFGSEMEKEIDKCIRNKLIKAKIDLAKKVVKSYQNTPKMEILQVAKRQGEKFIRDSKAMMIRLELQSKGLYVSKKSEFDDLSDEEDESGGRFMRGLGFTSGFMNKFRT